jgi:hypothetical protein
LARKIEAQAPGGAQIALLRGSADLISGREILVEKSISSFETAIEGTANSTSDSVALESKLGLIKAYGILGQFQKASELCSAVAAEHPWFSPISVIKAKYCVMLGDWGTCATATKATLLKDPFDLQALTLMFLYLLAQKGDYLECARKLRDILQVSFFI